MVKCRFENTKKCLYVQSGLVCCHTRVLKTRFCVLKLCCINWVSENLSTEATYTSIYRVFGRFIAEKGQTSTFELAKIDIILQRKCLENNNFS